MEAAPHWVREFLEGCRDLSGTMLAQIWKNLYQATMKGQRPKYPSEAEMKADREEIALAS